MTTAPDNYFKGFLYFNRVNSYFKKDISIYLPPSCINNETDRRQIVRDIAIVYLTISARENNQGTAQNDLLSSRQAHVPPLSAARSALESSLTN